MLTAKQKATIRERVHMDSIVFKSDGTVAFRRAYFYRHGNDPDKVAAKLKPDVEALGFKFEVIETADKWVAWPKTSYFVVTARITSR